MPRWRGWISFEATGKFSSRWPFPDRKAVGSLVMGSKKLLVGVSRPGDIERNVARNATLKDRRKAQCGTTLRVNPGLRAKSHEAIWRSIRATVLNITPMRALPPRLVTWPAVQVVGSGKVL